MTHRLFAIALVLAGFCAPALADARDRLVGLYSISALIGLCSIELGHADELRLTRAVVAAEDATGLRQDALEDLFKETEREVAPAGGAGERASLCRDAAPRVRTAIAAIAD